VSDRAQRVQASPPLCKFDLESPNRKQPLKELSNLNKTEKR
jgi:hypothetical protein